MHWCFKSWSILLQCEGVHYSKILFISAKDYIMAVAIDKDYTGAGIALKPGQSRRSKELADFDFADDV